MLGVHLLFVYVSIILLASTGTDSFRAIQLLKDSEFMVSKNGDFKLGFFSLLNSKSRYLGIWFNKPSVQEYVWVANRNNPLIDSSGVLRISEDGNLQVVNGKSNTLWTTNLPEPVPNASRNVQLSDNGNFVLQEFYTSGTIGTNGTLVWQTFGHPTDSIIAGMKVTLSGSNVTKMLRCWKSPSDPSYGRFTLGMDSTTHSQLVIWDGDQIRWRTGPWNGNIFLGLIYSDPTNNYADTYVEKNDMEQTATFVYTGARQLTFSHYYFSYDGALNEVWWDGGKKSWKTVYKAPDIECDFYGKCGVFGTCNPLKSPICRCLKGFRPKSAEEYSRGHWSGGCVRRTPLHCGNPGSKQDGFLVFKKVKLPDLEESLPGLNPNDCRAQCLKNCSCLAYAYDAGARCMHWSKDLIDIQEYTGSGIDLYLRVAHSELSDKGKRKAVIALIVVLVTSSIILLIIFLWRWLNRWKAKEARRKNILESHMYRDNRSRSKTNLEELPLFELEILADATNDFHESHKLGQGGFGQVYKGRLEDGREIAVKRLSATSGQGLEEFTNEVLLISKLQHKNLVSLVGFCVEGEEKLLIYEYMPNKSLDVFLFDPTKGDILDWTRRFIIIEGICRGLIYLHRDSRLRIIHRDLKASNILLDEDYNPKISDFGMARIFGHGQDLEKTRRVVGTYGYMSPEYAMEGHFSEKSDVFSFGVLLLEIVSGKRNNSFWFEEESLTLLGYAWKLWIEGDVSSIIDPFISDPVFRKEIERSIQVGLLCVQQYAKDRPSMSVVMSMLASDIADLPHPKQPGFNRRQIHLDTSSSQVPSSYADDVSFTSVTGR